MENRYTKLLIRLSIFSIIWVCLIEFYLNDLPPLFLGANIAGKLWSNVLVGFFVSSIFYFVVYYFPEKINKANSLKIISRSTLKIEGNFDIVTLYLLFMMNAHRDIDNKRIKDLELSGRAKSLKISKNSTFVKDNNGKFALITDEIDDLFKSISNEIDIIFKFPTYVDTSFLVTIAEARELTLRHLLSYLSVKNNYFEKQGFEDGYVLSDYDVANLDNALIQFDEVRKSMRRFAAQIKSPKVGQIELKFGIDTRHLLTIYGSPQESFFKTR